MADIRGSAVPAVPNVSDLSDADTILITDFDASPKKTYRMTVAQARTLFSTPSSDDSGTLGGDAKRWSFVKAMKALFTGTGRQLTIGGGGNPAAVLMNNADGTKQWVISAGGTDLVLAYDVTVDAPRVSVDTNGVLHAEQGVEGDLTGNADTATKLAAAVQINGEDFDGSENITITAAAGAATTGAIGSVKTDYDGGATPIAQLASTIRRIVVAADGSAVGAVDTTIGTFAAVPVGTYIAHAKVRVTSGGGGSQGTTIKLVGSTPANLTNAISHSLSPSSTTSFAVAEFEGTNVAGNICHIDSSGGASSGTIEWYFTVVTGAIDIAWSYAAASGGDTIQIRKGSFIELIRVA